MGNTRKNYDKDDAKRLKEASAYARKLLAGRGIIAPEGKSISDSVVLGKYARDVILPGYENYIPHRVVIEQSLVVMKDLAVIWYNLVKGEPNTKGERSGEFFRFAIKELSNLERERDKDIQKAKSEGNGSRENVLLWERATIKAMAMYLYDCFAVCLVEHRSFKYESLTTSEFLEWFLEYSQKLISRFWEKPKADTPAPSNEQASKTN